MTYSFLLRNNISGINLNTFSFVSSGRGFTTHLLSCFVPEKKFVPFQIFGTDRGGSRRALAAMPFYYFVFLAPVTKSVGRKCILSPSSYDLAASLKGEINFRNKSQWGGEEKNIIWTP